MTFLNDSSHNLQPLIDLRSLRVFLVIAETGNMTHTASQLGLTQSAVSQSLQQLEQILKVELFDRTKRPLRMTVEGLALRENARWLVNEAVQLPSRMQGISGQKLPRIRIGLVDSFAATIGPHLIRQLLREAVQLSVWTGLTPAQGDALMLRNRDMIVTSDALDDFDALQRHPILKEPFILLLPAADVARFESMTLAELAAAAPLVRYSARSHTGVQIERHLRRMSIETRRTLEIDTSDTLVAMVGAGIGWAVTTPLSFLQGRANAEKVRAVRLPGPTLTRQLSLVARVNEYGDLPSRIASFSKDIFRSTIESEIKVFVPWLDYTFISP